MDIIASKHTQTRLRCSFRKAAMPWASVITGACIGLVVLSFAQWASLNLTMLASAKKEEKPMRKMASQFMLLGSSLIETIWTIEASIIASILSS